MSCSQAAAFASPAAPVAAAHAAGRAPAAVRAGRTPAALLGRLRAASLPAGLGKAVLTTALFAAGIALCLATGTSVSEVMDGFSFNVLVILVAMDLFTGVFAQTGAMEVVAVKLAVLSRGRRRLLVAALAGMMFLVSSILNNITAILVILPCVFVLLRALEPDRRYLTTLFAVILAASNLGGAATGVGDLPAVLIVQSGVVSFSEYTLGAFPFFAASTAVLGCFWALVLGLRGRAATSGVSGRQGSELAIGVLQSQYRHIGIDRGMFVPLAAILAAMIVAWMVVPQDAVPSDLIAVLGCMAAFAVALVKRGKVGQVVDMGSVLTIGSFLFLAACISATGALDAIAAALRGVLPDDRMYLVAILTLTSLLAGLVGAGPAAACCLPIVCDLACGAFAGQRVAVMVAYGAAICAGSSLFLWSATAGFILSGKVEASGVRDGASRPARFGIGDYLGYGLVNYVIQFGLALALVAATF